MFSNPMQLIMGMRQAGNPQQFMLNIMRESAGQNPIYANLFQLAQKNDTKAIEQIARNLLQEKGLNFDQEFNNFRNQFKI